MTNRTRFIHGHNARTNAKALAEARALKRTPESEAYRLEKSRKGIKKAKEAGVYSKAVKRTWEEHRDAMEAGSTKGAATRRRMFASGQLSINREKISESMCRLYVEGGGPSWSRGHYEPLETKSTKPRSYYRSSWEKIAMEKLDLDPAVTQWTHEPTWISYTHDGVKRRYVPDFLVRYEDGTTVLMEVGVKSVKDMPQNISKRSAAQTFCEERGWMFRLLTEQDILTE
jgi:hypothetical protein